VFSLRLCSFASSREKKHAGNDSKEQRRNGVFFPSSREKKHGGNDSKEQRRKGVFFASLLLCAFA
jgi:hypothetical protein